jgi:hypothetical protein
MTPTPMTTNPYPQPVNLSPGELLRIQAPRGLEVHVDEGHLWITEEAQPDDVWLAAGQRVRLIGQGLAVIEAKGPAKIRIAGSRAGA